MTDSRHQILGWAEQGHITGPNLRPALLLGEVLPDRQAWRDFLDRLSLWMGMALVAAGLIFFLAYNWNELERIGKLALAETAVIGALLAIWRLGVDRIAGKATLFGACLALGALLALIGQTYQTGADTFELFIAWAAMILPWVLVGRFTALWVLWLTLINLAIVLYFQVRPNLFGILFATEQVLWVLFAFNTVVLAVWEALAAREIDWLRGRWGPRLAATASGGFITVLAMYQILDWSGAVVWGVPLWFAWLGAAWALYRLIIKDVYVLAGGVLSVIFVVATFFVKHLSDHDAGGFLIVGLIIIALSGVGGWWLKQVSAEIDR